MTLPRWTPVALLVLAFLLAIIVCKMALIMETPREAPVGTPFRAGDSQNVLNVRNVGTLNYQTSPFTPQESRDIAKRAVEFLNDHGKQPNPRSDQHAIRPER